LAEAYILVPILTSLSMMIYKLVSCDLRKCVLVEGCKQLSTSECKKLDE